VTTVSSVHVSSDRATQLTAAAAEAAQVRTALADPNVIALRIERRRTLYNVLIWASVVVGLAFTASNVQQFAAHGASPASLAWWFAWLLDPTITLALVAVLVAEEVTSTWSVDTPTAAARVKWVTLLLTYCMNTWGAWSVLNVRLIILHSAPVIGVFVIVGAAPRMRDALTEAVHRSAGPVSQDSQDSPDSTVGQPDTEPAPTPDSLPAPVRSAPVEQNDWTGLEDYQTAGREVARLLGPDLSRNKLRAAFTERGLSIGTDRANRVVGLLKAERAQRPTLHAVGGEI
jgi:hypothetical protein